MIQNIDDLDRIRLGRRSFELAQREHDPSCCRCHEASTSSIECSKGAQHGKYSSRTIDTNRRSCVGSGDELSNAEEEKSQNKQAQDGQNGNVCSQCGNEKDEG